MPLKGNIFVTGGTGTLACALLRTAAVENWDAEFTMYSRSELRQSQLKAKFPHVRTVLGDIRDYDRLSAAMAGHTMALHFAAMKRIPECEQFPSECIATNVLGSQNVVRACIANRVQRCVATSTDKACRSVTCYGSSKQIMEALFKAQIADPCTFTLVRYGNVVASNGSVIPLWRQQAKQGQPISVTQKDATRFWMAESDAVALIQQASGAQAGTITVPKMRSLTLVELASIVAPGADVVETGFRSVEKRHEDLVSEDEISADAGDVFIIGHPQGSTGNWYTSYEAPRLMPAAFRSMLAEAESHE